MAQQKSLSQREARLAFWMLAPTFLIVFAVVIFPVLANFWISFKNVELGDLRAPTPVVRERAARAEPGEPLEVRYLMRNSSQDVTLRNVTLTAQLPAGLTPTNLPNVCAVNAQAITCDFGEWEGGYSENLELTFQTSEAFFNSDVDPREPTRPTLNADASNILTNFNFTLQNFRFVLSGREFWPVLWTTLAYTLFGTGGSILLGLFAAQLLQGEFFGKGFLRGLFLFPYVAPVIAVAFAWVLLLDAGPGGTLNAMLSRMGATDGPINFLGQRAVPIDIFGFTFEFPVALTTVIAFEAWRYFPLAFLFILARMQSVSSDMYEAAEIDGATPLQQFRYISLPQLAGILSVLFLLRFIWTFNKFDDIFLLTGGASGTRTLVVDVYEQAFGLSNLGAGAAVAVVVFVVLLSFAIIFFRFSPQDDG